jgi:hypothetical protein
VTKMQQAGRSPSTPGRRPKLRRAPLVALLAAAFLVTGCVAVTPSSNVNPANAPLRATGQGFGDTNPVGIYVAFGPDPATLPADWFTKIDLFQTAAWVHANGTNTATNKKMNEDGSFDFTLTRADGSPITAVYTNGFGDVVDCRVVKCGVVIMKAHGSTDRTWDRFNSVSFRANP